MKRTRESVARALEALVARHVDSSPGAVADAIRYALEGEGKRLRARLVIEAYEAGKAPLFELEPA